MYQNRISLIGFTGKDAEARTTTNQTAYAILSLATKSSYKDKKSGQYVSHTEWHRIVLFGKQAEIFGDRAVKGALIHVEGSLQTREWTDRDGNKRYTTEIVARFVQVLGKREHPVTEPPAAEEPPAPQEHEVPEDDIPF
jgi:single-strand DNA-binding protein